MILKKILIRFISILMPTKRMRQNVRNCLAVGFGHTHNRVPKILKSEDAKWRKVGLQIVYVGQHPDNPDRAVYVTRDISGKVRYTGYPTVYLVYDDKYDKINNFDALDILAETQREIDKKSYKDFVDKLKEFLAKVNPDKIKMYSIEGSRNRVYILMNGDDRFFCFEDISQGGVIKFSDPEVLLQGEKYTFKELFDLIEPYRKQAEPVIWNSDLCDQLLSKKNLKL